MSFDEVFANYVLPNSVEIPISSYLASSNQPQKGNNNNQQNVQPVNTYDFIAAISTIILSNSSMMFGGTMDGFFQEIPQESVLYDWLTMSDADKISILINSIREAREEGNESINLREIFTNIPKITAGMVQAEEYKANFKQGDIKFKLTLQVTIDDNLNIFTVFQHKQVGPFSEGVYKDHWIFVRPGGNFGILDFYTNTAPGVFDIMCNWLNP